MEERDAGSHSDFAGRKLSHRYRSTYTTFQHGKCHSESCQCIPCQLHIYRSSEPPPSVFKWPFLNFGTFEGAQALVQAAHILRVSWSFSRPCTVEIVTFSSLTLNGAYFLTTGRQERRDGLCRRWGLWLDEKCAFSEKFIRLRYSAIGGGCSWGVRRWVDGVVVGSVDR